MLNNEMVLNFLLQFLVHHLYRGSSMRVIIDPTGNDINIKITWPCKQWVADLSESAGID